jgi:hypothetical protein
MRITPGLLPAGGVGCFNSDMAAVLFFNGIPTPVHFPFPLPFTFPAMNEVKITPQQVANLSARGSLRHWCVEVDCVNYERAARVVESDARDGQYGRASGC